MSECRRDGSLQRAPLCFVLEPGGDVFNVFNVFNGVIVALALSRDMLSSHMQREK